MLRLLQKEPPVLNLAMVTTALPVGEVSLDTRACSEVTMAAAATTGSVDKWGMAPCPPLPLTVTQNLSAAAMSVPACTCTTQKSSPAAVQR